MLPGYLFYSFNSVFCPLDDLKNYHFNSRLDSPSKTLLSTSLIRQLQILSLWTSRTYIDKYWPTWFNKKSTSCTKTPLNSFQFGKFERFSTKKLFVYIWDRLCHQAATTAADSTHIFSSFLSDTLMNLLDIFLYDFLNSLDFSFLLKRSRFSFGNNVWLISPEQFHMLTNF